MTPHYHPTRHTVALALAISAVVPPAAAHAELNPVPAATTRLRQPAVQIVRVSTSGRFSWVDAGIGAAAGFGLSMLTIGGRLLIADKPRHTASPH